MKNYVGIGVSGLGLINLRLKAMIGAHGSYWREEDGVKPELRRSGYDQSSVAQLH